MTNAFIDRLLTVFEGRVIELPAASHGNVAVMAFRQSPTLTQWEALKKRADELEGRHGVRGGDVLPGERRSIGCAYRRGSGAHAERRQDHYVISGAGIADCKQILTA